MRGGLRVAVSLSLVALLAPASGANTFDIFGYNGRSVAMGGALTAGANDYTALFYNPAALTLEPKVNLGAGGTLMVPALYIDREANDGGIEASLPELNAGLHVGWRYPLGGIFEEKVAIGLGVYLPVGRLIGVQGLDPARPQFYLYQNLQDKLVILAGVAYRPVEWFSVGIGVQLLADIDGGATLALNAMNSTFETAGFEIDLVPSGSLTGGLHFTPTPELNIGLTYRGESGLTFVLPVVVSEGDALSLSIDVSQTVLWTPHEFALGISYFIPDVKLLVSVDLTYGMWSRAPDPSPRLSVDIGGRLVEGLGLGSALDISTGTPNIDMQFSDTLTPRIGFEWEPPEWDWLRVRMGYYFRPTPAPRQTGATAYLDNDAHVASLGLGFIFADPFDLKDTPIEVDVAYSATILPRRTALRAKGDPVGSMSHGGAMHSLAASISHRY